MSYNPSLYAPLYNPVNMPNQQMNPINGLVSISDVDGAKSYQMPPNSVSPPLMLESDNIFIIKETDGSGGATLKAFKFEEIPISSLAKPEGEYVTKADFEEFTATIMEAINGKHAAKSQQTTE